MKAEEFYEKEMGRHCTGPIDHEDVMDIMIKFAQYHVQKALEVAQKNQGLIVDGVDYLSDTYTIEAQDTYYRDVEIRPKTIGNIYPLEQIK